jgi:hypothetical protein
MSTFAGPHLSNWIVNRFPLLIKGFLLLSTEFYFAIIHVAVVIIIIIIYFAIIKVKES